MRFWRYGDRGNSNNSVTATHFGQGVYDGQILTAWARYEDLLVSTEEG